MRPVLRQRTRNEENLMSFARNMMAWALLVSSAVACLPASAADTPAAVDKQYRRMPWHLIDVWWDLGKNQAFESYSIDVEFSDDVSSAVNLYVSPVGLGHLSGTAFYGGIQTQCDGYTAQERRLRKLGPGLLMSMWGQRSLDAIRPSDGGFLQSSGHEGDFVSVRRPYQWSKGKYTYRVVRMDREEVQGKPFTWIGAFCYSHARNENIFIGALRFPGENLTLDRKIASFVEIYGQLRPVSDIPKLTVTFDNLRVNGKPVEKLSATAIYPKDVPDYASTAAKGQALEITVGQPVENRSRRQEKFDLK